HVSGPYTEGPKSLSQFSLLAVASAKSTPSQKTIRWQAPTGLSDTGNPVFQYGNALHHPQKRPIFNFLQIH
ncbi:hypothetical protein, partial [Pseudomonas sp. GM78]|uniref:hypothetical protein n=1 Tax=Pseudomonas sp. GM78 TaxID=1144337 RepID=UPI001EE68F82